MRCAGGPVKGTARLVSAAPLRRSARSAWLAAHDHHDTEGQHPEHEEHGWYEDECEHHRESSYEARVSQPDGQCPRAEDRKLITDDIRAAESPPQRRRRPNPACGRNLAISGDGSGVEPNLIAPATLARRTVPPMTIATKTMPVTRTTRDHTPSSPSAFRSRR